MNIPEFLIDAVGIFKLLLVFSSALFAIAQYYENRHRKTIEQKQEKTKGINLEEAAFNDADIRRAWQDILNEKPRNNQYIIIPLLVLIVIFNFLFVLSLLSDWFTWLLLFLGVTLDVPKFINVTLKLSSIVLLSLGVYLIVNWFKMKRDYKDFSSKVDKVELISLYLKK